MNAFDDGRVGLAVASMQNWSDGRRLNAAKLFGGMFTDIFLPRGAQLADADKVRATVRPDGSKLKAHLWTPPHELSAKDYAEQVVADAKRIRPGVVDLDIEENAGRLDDDGTYTAYIAEVLWLLRVDIPSRTGDDWLTRIPLGLNVAPYKGRFLPKDWIAKDPALYVTAQCYYGDMSRVSEAELLLDLLDAGVPRARARVIYGAATEPRGADGKYDPNGKRHLALPTVFYEGRLVRKLARGTVFSDDLLADLGLL